MTDEHDDHGGRLSEAVKQRNAFAALIRTEGWAMLKNILNSQVELRRNDFELTPLDSMDKVLGQEFKKGEIASLRLVLELPQNVLEDAEAVIAEAPKLDENNGDDDA